MGLIPHWAKDDKLAYSTFNARSEEFTTKPAFKDAWRLGRRCLVVTNGFYEWKKLDPKGKLMQAYAVGMADDGEMVMAGLWSTWRNPANGEEVQSCTVLTCAPNDAMADIQPHAGDPGRGRMAEMARRGAGHGSGTACPAPALPRRTAEDLARR